MKISDVQFSETITFDSADITISKQDGYLAATPRVARTGIQIYAGKEVGRPDLDRVRVYRAADEVFSDASMKTYAHRPLTDDHPPVPVTSKNWKDYSVGQTGAEVVRDGEFIRVPMKIMDAKTVKAVQDGKKQLSVGYTTDLQWQSGEVNGEQYDAIQTNIRMNHLAVVAMARGGRDLSIGDNQHGAKRTMKIITVDGLNVEVSDDNAGQIVLRALATKDASEADLKKKLAALQDEVAATKAALAKATGDSAAALTAKDAEIASTKKLLADAEAKSAPAAIDAAAKVRGEMLVKASAMLGDKLVIDAKSDAEIRRQVVDAQLGDAAKGYSDADVVVAFNVLTAKVTTDGKSGTGTGTNSNTLQDAARVISGMTRPAANTGDKRDEAYNTYETDLQDAWRGPKAAAH